MADQIATNARGKPLTDQNGNPVYVDSQGREYNLVNGQKVYARPIGMNAAGGVTYDPSQLASFNNSGGMIHKPSLWNATTGQYDPGALDWGALGPLLGLAGISGVAGAAALSGGAAGAAGGTTGAAGAAGGATSAYGPLAEGYGLATTTAAAPAGIAGGSGMSILDTIGSLVKPGSKVDNILNIAGKIGNVASNAAAGAASGRMDQAAIQQRQDALNLQRYQDQIAGAKLNLDAPGQRAGNAVRGDILANAQPFQWTGSTHQVGNIPVPDATGGLSPALFSDSTRALGKLLPTQALTQQQTNGGNAIGAPPDLTSLPTPSGIDSLLSTAGTLGSFAGAGGSNATDPVQTYLNNLKKKGQPNG